MWVRVCGSGGRRSAIEEEKVVMEKQSLRAGGRKGKFTRSDPGTDTAKLVIVLVLGTCDGSCVRSTRKWEKRKRSYG